MLIGKNSSSAHELLLHFLFGRTRSLLVLLEPGDVLLDLSAGEPSLDPEGPRKGTTAECELQALGAGVQMRSPAGCPPRWIRNDRQAGSLVTDDDSQQLLGGGPLSTTDTGADDVCGHA
jgi:hypothetical protein